jgi:hydrogenase-4 component F
VALAVVLLPLAFAVLALVVANNRARPLLLPLAASLHLVLTCIAIVDKSTPDPGELLGLDPLGRLVLLLVSVLFFVVSFCATASSATTASSSPASCCSSRAWAS